MQAATEAAQQQQDEVAGQPFQEPLHQPTKGAAGPAAAEAGCSVQTQAQGANKAPTRDTPSPA